MHQLIFKPRAIEMQAEAYKWYEAKRTGLGELFLQELEVNYGKLQSNPLVYRISEAGYGHVILKKFPFVIVFKIIKNTLVVYAVFHTSRNPKQKLRGKR